MTLNLAQHVLSDIANGRVEKRRKRDETYSVRQLEARARGTRQQALNWLNKEGPVSNALARFWTSTYARMRDSGIPAMRALAATLQRGKIEQASVLAVKNWQLAQLLPDLKFLAVTVAALAL